jgi:cytochrome c-type biogenesis protein
MNLELAAIPLAFLAGILGVLSPCVWPLVPIVMGSAASRHRFGPYALALGLSIAFALAGTALSFLLVSFELDPEIFRYIASALLIVAAFPLIISPLGEWLAVKLSALTGRFNPDSEQAGLLGQFSLGFLLGLVWLPCVGPTLGAAIALASFGQQMVLAFVVMLSFGIGTALVLLLAGILSQRALRKISPTILGNSGAVKKFLGVLILLLGISVFMGWDKAVETWAVEWLPEWTTEY